MQNKKSSNHPQVLARHAKHALVQFNEDDVFLLSDEECKDANIKIEGKIASFSPEKNIDTVQGKKLNDIIDRQVFYYGPKKHELFVFRIIPDVKKGKKEEEKEKEKGPKIWLSKTAFIKALATKDKNGTDFKKTASILTYKDGSPKKVGHVGDVDDDDDNEDDEDDEDDEEDGDDDGDVIMDDSEPVPSVEVQDSDSKLSTRGSTPTAKHTTRKKGTRKVREPSTERDESPGMSRETPAPRDGGITIYGINCVFGTTKRLRGLVLRDNAYSFELLHDCSPNLIIPGQKAGMAPSADDVFVSKLNRNDRSKFDIIGCTAKWHGRPNKHVLVILKINKGENLSNELKLARDIAKYEYKGPLVCKLSTYRKVFKEDDIPKLEELLGMTEFAEGATDEELSLKRGTNITRSQVLYKLERLILAAQSLRPGIESCVEKKPLRV